MQKKVFLAFVLILAAYFTAAQSTYINRSPLIRPGPQLTRTIGAMASTQTIMVMFMGDSTMSADSLSGNIVETFAANYGFCGYVGEPGHIEDWAAPGVVYRYYSDVSATAYITNDLTHWYADSAILPPGGMLRLGEYSAGLAQAPMTGNVFQVTFASSNGYGGFSLATNDYWGSGGPGTYVVMSNIVCNAPPTQAYETNITVTFSNQFAVGTTLRATCLSNTVRIVSLGIMNYTRPGIIVNMQARPSLSLANWASVPTNFMGPVFAQWNPDLIIFKTINSGAVVVSNNLPNFRGFIGYNMPRSDFVACGFHPMDVNDSDVISLDLALNLTSKLMGWQYFPGHELFRDSWQNGFNMGYLQAGTPHLNDAGANFFAQALWTWMNLKGDRGLIMGPRDLVVQHDDRNYFGFVAAGGKTNAYEAWQQGGIMGGIRDNGWAFNKGSNMAAVFPATYRLYSQKAVATATNLAVTAVNGATNGLIGTASDGQATAGPQVWETNRTLTITGRGQYWTGATPGQCLIAVNLTIPGTTTTNTLCLSRFTPPASQNPGNFNFTATLCVSNSAILADGQLVTLNGSTPTFHTLTNQFTTGLNLAGQATVGLVVTNGAPTDAWQMAPLVVQMQ